MLAPGSGSTNAFTADFRSREVQVGRLLPRRLGLEFQRDRVLAVAIPRRPRSVGEHMPQVAAASRTGDLRAMHPEGPVVVQHDSPGLDRLPETRPTGPRLVLRR